MKIPINFLYDFGWFIRKRNYFPANNELKFMFERIYIKCDEEGMEKVFNYETGMRHIERLRRINKKFIYEKIFEPMFVPDPKGEDGRTAFFKIKNNGISVRTKHPNIVYSVLRTQASAKLWMGILADQIMNGILRQSDFESLCKKIEAPSWFLSGTILMAYNMRITNERNVKTKMN